MMYQHSTINNSLKGLNEMCSLIILKEANTVSPRRHFLIV